MAWREWVRTVEIEPSIYAADFTRLGDQVQSLLNAGVRIFHFDIGDGHFIPPVTIGPIVLRSIAPMIHRMDGRIDCHLMVDNPPHHFEEIAASGGDSVTFHVEVVDDVGAVLAEAREHGLGVGVAFNPGTPVEVGAEAANLGADLCLCMSIEPGYSGQEFLEESYPRIERAARARRLLRAGGRRCQPGQRQQGAGGRSGSDDRRERHLLARGSAAGLQTAGTSTRMSLERALELAAEANGRAYPKPTVGAVIVADGQVVGEGATEETGRHGEIVALEAAGELARGATLFVTMEPCTHHGTTPPCVDAVLAAGVSRVVAGSLDPNPEAQGGLERLRASGVEVEHADSFDARRQNEAWRTWVALGRPFVTYKAAMTLDGRLTVPGERWVSGEASRRLVHELRASSDVVAVGMGTVRLENPRLDARDVDAQRQPRRLAFGSGPLPEGSVLELRSGPLEEELRSIAADGVQSLLLEGGPTLARAFLEAGLVDKLLLFVAPTLSGAGPGLVESLSRPLDLRRLSSRQVGEDVLLEAYLREP